MTKLGHDCITTYAERFSKASHAVRSQCCNSATEIADVFYEGIFSLHELLHSIIS